MTYLYSQSKWTQKKKYKKIASISDKIWAPELELIVGGGGGGRNALRYYCVSGQTCLFKRETADDR